MSITVSGADGAILPPFTAGLLPPEVSAIVIVQGGPGATVETLEIDANVVISGLSASAEVVGLTAGVETVTVSAEV
jgi:hypothetical protein